MANNSAESPVSQNDPLAIQCLALFGFALLLVSLLFYLYVFVCMIKAKLWTQNSFYLILLSLGVADNCCIVALLYIYATASVRHVFLSLFGRTLIGIFVDYVSLVMHWHYLYIAIIRALSVVFPTKAQIWFTNKKVLGGCLFLWLLGVAHWGVNGGLTGDIVHFDIITFLWTLSWPEEYIEVPGGVYGLFYNFIGFTCLPFYIVAFVQLRKSSQGGSTAHIKAQWNLLKLGFICMVFVVSSGNFWQAATFGWLGTGFWVSCAQSILHILLLGINPFIYVTTSSQIRSCVPLICHKSSLIGGMSGAGPSQGPSNFDSKMSRNKKIKVAPAIEED